MQENKINRQIEKDRDRVGNLGSKRNKHEDFKT